MAAYVKFKLEDGTNVYLEVIDGPKGPGGLIPTTRGENADDQTAISFEDSFQSVQKMVSLMVQSLQEGFETEPDEVNMSFGIKASADVNNLVISRGGSDNNFGISVRWRKEKKSDQTDNSEE